MDLLICQLNKQGILQQWAVGVVIRDTITITLLQFCDTLYVARQSSTIHHNVSEEEKKNLYKGKNSVSVSQNFG